MLTTSFRNQHFQNGCRHARDASLTSGISPILQIMISFPLPLPFPFPDRPTDRTTDRTTALSILGRGSPFCLISRFVVEPPNLSLYIYIYIRMNQYLSYLSYILPIIRPGGRYVRKFLIDLYVCYCLGLFLWRLAGSRIGRITVP